MADQAANEEQLQKLAYEAQLYQQQGQLLKQQLDVLQATSAELAETIGTLKGLSPNKQGKLVPVGSGAFLRAKDLDSSNVLINVGSSLVLELPVASAIALLQKREASAKDVRENLQKNLSNVGMRLGELESAAQRLMGGGVDVRPSQE